MPFRDLDDGTGETIHVLELDGYFCPTYDVIPNQEEEVRSLPQWECRPDDVFICAYPKAGIYKLWAF